MRSNTAVGETRLRTSCASVIAHFIGVSKRTRMVSPILAAGGKEFRIEVTVDNDHKTLLCRVSTIANPSSTEPRKLRVSLLNQKGKPNLVFEPRARHDYESETLRCLCNETLLLDPNQLLDHELGVCVDDKIIVKVDLEFDVESTTRILPTLAGCSLAEEFRELLFQPSLSDVSIVVRSQMESSAIENVTIPAHSLMLSVGSSVFREMLHSGMQETSAKTIHLTDFDEDTVRDFLTFLYTGRCSMHDEKSIRGFDQARKLMQFAHQYDVRPLQADCEIDLELHWLTADTVLAVLQLAEDYNAAHLKTAALQFVTDNARLLVSHAAFLDMLAKECNVAVIRALGGLVKA